MHEYDVVVEGIDVANEQEEFYQQGNEEPNESRVFSFLVIVVKLEQISVLVLIRHVNDRDQHKV
jgi:hypothetical protein